MHDPSRYCNAVSWFYLQSVLRSTHDSSIVLLLLGLDFRDLNFVFYSSHSFLCKMGLFTKPRRASQTSISTLPPAGDDSKVATQDVVTNRDDSESQGGASHTPDDRPAEDAQQGVKEVEAVTLSWSKKTLYAVFGKYVHHPLTPDLCLRKVCED